MKKFILLFLFFLVSFKANANENIHVAYNIDDKYSIYMLLSINSILKNNKSNSEYTFWILDNGISEKNKKLIKKYIEDRKQNVNFLSLKENALYQKYLPLITAIFDFTEFAHVSHVSFMRLFIPSILPDDVHKVIYMDGDTLALQDLKDLFQTNLEDYTIGMVEDVSDTLKEICGTDTYYNAGVVLINTDKWKDGEILEKLLLSFKHHSLTYQKYAEQDLLNCELSNDIMKLKPKWNNQVFRQFVMEEYDNTGIFHFIAWEKPWNTFGSDVKYKPYKTYFDYWNASGLRKYKYKAVFDTLKKHFSDEKKRLSEEWGKLKSL